MVSSNVQKKTVANVIVIENATAILPDRLLPEARVVLRDGRIAEVGRAGKRAPRDAQVIDARGGFISPGFVDVHVHGGGGADFMDGTPDAVRTGLRDARAARHDHHLPDDHDRARPRRSTR